MKVIKHDTSADVLYPVWKYGRQTHALAKFYVSVFEEHVIPQGESLNKGIVVTGSSGAFLAGMMAAQCEYLRYPHRIFYLRKPGEDAHSADNEMQFGRYPRYTQFWFVDDFISCGETLNRVMSFFTANRNGEGGLLPTLAGAIYSMCEDEDSMRSIIERHNFPEFICHTRKR